MSEDVVKKAEQLESELVTIRARLKVALAQRDEALNNAVVSKAASDVQIDHLNNQMRAFTQALQKAHADTKRLTEELTVVRAEKAASARPADVMPVSVNANGHDAAEACAQA